MDEQCEIEGVDKHTLLIFGGALAVNKKLRGLGFEVYAYTVHSVYFM